MFLLRKTQFCRNMKIFMGSYFPTRAGMIRMISFGVWFEARMRLFRDGDEEQGTQGQVRKRQAVCTSVSSCGGEACPRGAFHSGFSPALPNAPFLECELSLMHPSTTIATLLQKFFYFHTIMRQKYIRNGIPSSSTQHRSGR